MSSIQNFPRGNLDTLVLHLASVGRISLLPTLQENQIIIERLGSRDVPLEINSTNNNLALKDGSLITKETTTYQSRHEGTLIVVNGKVSYTSPGENLPEIRISLPSGFHITGKLDGIVHLVSQLPLKTINLTMTGQTRLTLGIIQGISVLGSGQCILDIGKLSGNCFGKLSGNCRLQIKEMTGTLHLHLSGHSQGDINGTFCNIMGKISGHSTLKTEGLCLGDYQCQSRGLSKGNHQGEIKGKVS